MKFFLFMAAVCLGYYLCFRPSDIPVDPAPTQVEQVQSTRNHEPETLENAIPWGWVACLFAVWVVIRYVRSTGSARAIWQGSSRTKARNAMHTHIKNSHEKVTDAIRGSDELGEFEAIYTRDSYGNSIGYWTEDTDKYPK